MKEMVGGCCVCSDERGWPDNPLVYCDGNGCTVAVHQACYGIVTVPTGPWYCRKCESPETKGKVRCELCPSRSGALKKADTGGWAHVVCALYIPEVRFGNVTSMEPIVLRLIPPERFTRTCYICTENGKSHRASQGACMACNKSGCKQQFHVTCAQSLGLLCEEAGNYLDNVKYCGYCQHHYAKLFTNHEVTVIAKKKGGNVKTIPPYKPVAHDSQSSGSSSEKEGGASPMAGGSGTPTPHTKGSKGPGRKSSQNKDSSKSSPASKAASATTPQPMDKKKSPSRRQSSTSDGTAAGSSKGNTPSPSPSHSADTAHSSKPSTSAGASGSRSTPPATVPSSGKSPQSGGVISSVASAAAAGTSASGPVASTSTGITTSVVQATPTKLSVTFQESVITNTDAVETKHTKKRKAAAAAASAAAEQAAQANANEPVPTNVDPEPKQTKKRKAAAALDSQIANSPKPTGKETPPIANESANPPEEPPDVDLKHTKKRRAAAVASAAALKEIISAAASDASPSASPVRVTVGELETKHTKKRKAAAAEKAALALPVVSSEPQPGTSGAQWEQGQPNDPPVPMDTSDKFPKKVKTDSMTPPPAHYLSPPPQLPPPPPPPMRSPSRHLTSPLPGPSGMHPPGAMHPPTAIRSPLHHQAATEMPAPQSPHVFHQPLKPAAMDSGIPGHSPHGHAQRSNWGGLNVTYEMQQDPNKPSVSGAPGSSKDHGGVPMPMAAMPPMTPAMRNKKRAAMAAVTMAHQPSLPPPQSAIQMASTSTQSLASVRRHQPLPPPQPMYQDPTKDSPPVSPNIERQMKAKAEQQYYSKILSSAPHMLGNELNPESGAAARLQEQLNAELAAHAVGAAAAGPDPIIPPPLINKAAPGSSGRSTGAQSLDQLLERQWEQGSQFLMEQAQHFDIASLLSCLHQLRTENVRLEEHVANLLQRRDHLLAVNARLAIPLNAASAPPSEPARCTREGGGAIRAPPPPPPRPVDALAAERHAERLAHQLVMREVQQKPS